MDRRRFLQVSAAGVAGSVLYQAPAAGVEEKPTVTKPADPRPRMRVGCQRWGSSSKHLDFYLRNGVYDICISPAKGGPDRIWTAETCRAAREAVEAKGMRAVSMYWGVPIEVLVPEKRDGLIERCRKQIIAAGEGGIPALAYNLHIRTWRARTAKETGRGGGKYSVFDLKDVEPQRKPDIGPIEGKEHWKRITYFLEAVVPVAEKAKVKLSLHPNDPPMPDENKFGKDQVLDTVEGLKRFVRIADSPYHGLTFCQGSIWEMLEKKDQPQALFDAIEWFGKRGKIVQVHFRNLRGDRQRFAETYHDNGDIDMAAAVEAYRKVGYTGVLMPDHVPGHEDDPDGLQQFAFAYGYINGLIEATYARA
jgi:mannonate dehydratase